MIVILELKNGKYVIGKLLSNVQNIITLEHALSIDYAETVDYPAIYFSEYCPFNKSTEVHIHTREILHFFDDPKKEILKFYKENVVKFYGSKDQFSKFAELERLLIDDAEIH